MGDRHYFANPDDFQRTMREEQFQKLQERYDDMDHVSRRRTLEVMRWINNDGVGHFDLTLTWIKP